jgi:hypothetical protein
LEAAQNSVQHLGLACALTSLSTAVGFGSLVLASIYVIKIFGWTCAMGSVLSFLAVITVVPLVASTQLGKHLVANERSSRQPMLEALADKAITGLLARPYVVLVCGLVVTFALALLVTRLEPDHRIANEISHASESFQALQHVDKTFGGILFAYAVVHWPEARGPDAQEFYDVLEEVHHAFSENQVLENPLSFLNLIKSLPDADESLPQRAARWHYIPEDVLRLRGTGDWHVILSAVASTHTYSRTFHQRTEIDDTDFLSRETFVQSNSARVNGRLLPIRRMRLAINRTICDT